MSGEAAAWFERTGHCHACGQPGDLTEPAGEQTAMDL